MRLSGAECIEEDSQDRDPSAPQREGSSGTPGENPEDITGPVPEVSARRIPNLGDALLFVSVAGLVLLVFEFLLVLSQQAAAVLQGGALSIQHPKLQLSALAASYLTTLLAAWFFYPMVWHRTFLAGMQWHWSAARRQAGKLIGLGLLLGVMVQVVTNFITTPKTLPIDDFFRTQTDAWLITLFGTIAAPVFEEVCFRGFLVPAFAIAYDWLSLPRTPEARIHWQTTTSLNRAALIFSAVLSSLFFALLHAPQLAHVWAAVLVLFSVSLVLTLVRVKTQSVACSAMVHGAYNFCVFLTVMAATGGYRHLDRMAR